jgi:MoaA/NifB/PqqE/SkfB family radical SAM enzyme
MATDWIRTVERDTISTFRQAVRAAGWRPARLAFALRALWGQLRAAGARRRQRRPDLVTPPLLILSVTSRCNLACPGCYDRTRSRPAADELIGTALRAVLEEADDMGTRIVLLAGGEPLARRDLPDSLEPFKRHTFLLFTNGLLVTPALVGRFKRQGNVLPVISLEGGRDGTDRRRGRGAWDKIAQVCRIMDAAGLPYGHSITVTADNLDECTDPVFLAGLRRQGATVFIFVEYVPMEAGSASQVLGDSGRLRLRQRLEAARRAVPSLMIAFPGDEDRYGGCLAAGRGFVHVSAGGAVEACPFAPFSDADIGGGLRGALCSPLLRAIRELHYLLTETGGCALWANRDQLPELLGVAAPDRGIPAGAGK